MKWIVLLLNPAGGNLPPRWSGCEAGSETRDGESLKQQRPESVQLARKIQCSEGAEVSIWLHNSGQPHN